VTSVSCLTFLTDFGLEDGFVAACHGVAARIAPGARIIDITHLVPPGDVRRGAAVLAQTVPSMPPAVHVAVVDPGVGTRRRAVAVQAGAGILVGPDNGLLSWAITALGGARAAVLLTNEALWNQPVSRTFHGRDIFMPVAAHLATGTALADAGIPVDPAELVWLAPPTSRMLDGEAEGEVLSVDRFGNVQLSIPGQAAAELGIAFGGSLTIRCNRREIAAPYLETFGAASPGELIAFTDSAGLIALAITNGNAAEALSLPPGARVRIAPARADLPSLGTMNGRESGRLDVTCTEGHAGVPLRVPRIIMAVTAIGLASVPLVAAGAPAEARRVPSREWWLTAVRTAQAWRTSDGAGVTVAVLADGVDARQPDLLGSVIAGRSFIPGARRHGQVPAGRVGTGLASLIAGHGHGRRHAQGVTGVAPGARILPVTVTLTPGDPRWSDPEVTSRLPAAIAAGIRYAVSRGASVIVLPADPGMPASSGRRATPGAAGGSAAERAAVGYAIRRNVVLVAPAGDNGRGADAANYPAAYPGVIAVGSFARDFAISPYSNRRPYVALAGPGQDVTAAAPVGYQVLSTTWAASALVGGIAALVRSQFPDLTAAQVRRALTLGAVLRPRRALAGAGHGLADAVGALRRAATMSPPRARLAMAGARPRTRPAVPAAATPATTMARDMLADAGLSLGLLVLLLVPIIGYSALRRRRERRAALLAEARRLERERQPGGASARADPLTEYFGPAPAPPPGSPEGTARAGAARAAAPSPHPVTRIGAGGFLAAPIAATARLGRGIGLAARAADDAASGSADTAARTGDATFGAAPGTYLRSSVRRRPVSGGPPWDPAPEPTGEPPWARTPTWRPGGAPAVPESLPVVGPLPEQAGYAGAPRPSSAPRGLFDPVPPPPGVTDGDPAVPSGGRAGRPAPAAAREGQPPAGARGGQPPAWPTRAGPDVVMHEAGTKPIYVWNPSAPVAPDNDAEPWADDPQPWAGGAEPQADDPQPWAGGPEPQADDPQPWAAGPEPQADDPQPWAAGPEPRAGAGTE